jgi:hypothetical protein
LYNRVNAIRAQSENDITINGRRIR